MNHHALSQPSQGARHGLGRCHDRRHANASAFDLHIHCLWDETKNIRKYCKDALKDKANRPRIERRYTARFSLSVTWPNRFCLFGVVVPAFTHPTFRAPPPVFLGMWGSMVVDLAPRHRLQMRRFTSETNSSSELCSCRSDRSWVGCCCLRRRRPSGR